MINSILCPRSPVKFLFLPSLSLGLLALLPLHGQEEAVWLEPVVVKGRSEPLIGEMISASHGVISRQDIQDRAILRTGEILETVPGMIVTQHSGSGKANQYFLRGFNLDHGTDFSTSVDGIPVNMPTHAHGQGWIDLNFVIPELVDQIEFRKGPYYPQVGDFSSAGSAEMKTVNSLDRGIAHIGIGLDDYYRGMVADSFKAGTWDLLVGGEVNFYNGPWTINENLEKYIGLVKLSKKLDHGENSFTFMGYRGSWDSADQIPERAVRNGTLSRLGVVDPSDGGETSRYSLSSSLTRESDWGTTKATVYGLYYDLDLWSNFTFFLDDPVNGDQFAQIEKRFVLGGNLSHQMDRELFGKPTSHLFGLQLRQDFIDDVGLHHTQRRHRLDTTREDDVRETAVGLYYQNETHWTDRFRTIAGVRFDYFFFDVDAMIPANTGTEDDFLTSPKLSLNYQATDWLEVYTSGGFGFHSNDARGATTRVDPSTGMSTRPVDPLVSSFGAEIGTRFTWHEKFNTSLAYWYMELDSELLFVGDAGTTEVNPGSRRHGLEWANYYRPYKWLTLDFDLSLSEAEFKNGDHIPGALDTVLSTGLTLTSPWGVYSTLRARHFADAPLVEDGSVTSDSTTIFNLRVGYRKQNWDVYLDVLNLFDSDDKDISYYYESRLPGEPAGGVADRHSRSFEPLTARLGVTYRF